MAPDGGYMKSPVDGKKMMPPGMPGKPSPSKSDKESVPADAVGQRMIERSKGASGNKGEQAKLD